MELLDAVRHWPLEAVAALVAGTLILLVPRVLNYAIAIYLLVVGLLGLLQAWHLHSVSGHTLAALLAGVLILVRPAILSYVVGIYLILIGLMESGLLRGYLH